jgi:hypothetical protein
MKTMQVPEDVHAELKAIARREGRKVQAVAERVLRFALKFTTSEVMQPAQPKGE